MGSSGTRMAQPHCGARDEEVRVAVRAGFVVDASGPRGFLSRALGIEDRGFDGYPQTQALFSHFVDVARCDDMPDFAPSHPRTLAPSHLPYPIDDAALHHVFDGGWMWVLRFGNGVTSAGIAVTESLAMELRLSDGAARVGALPGALSVHRCAVRRRRSDPRVHVDATRLLPRLQCVRQRMGDAAVGGGVHRSVVLDGNSVDVAGD